ncbi:MAG TPA: hypothetical protein VFZ25_12160 [Chloroflexota bacterium]|nr:hypothetical protein [Chloroflexota bacterium]
MIGRIGLLVGILAGVTGGIGWIVALLVALSANGPEGVGPRTLTFFAIMLLAIVGVTTGAYLQSQRAAPGRLVLLWICTILLIVGTVISGFSVGVFFLPAAILALIASVMASFARPTTPAV